VLSATDSNGILFRAGNLLQRTVQLFIGNREARRARALQLNFLHHQTIEHLLLQHALRGQIDPLLPAGASARRDLNVELALQDQPSLTMVAMRSSISP